MGRPRLYATSVERKAAWRRRQGMAVRPHYPSAAAKQAGIDIAKSDHINRERWQKFVFLVGLSSATGATRMPLGAILADPETRAFFRSLMEEVVTLAKAKGIALDPGFLDDRMKFADAAPPGMKASLLHDLERGNRIEIDWLAGKVSALGRARRRRA